MERASTILTMMTAALKLHQAGDLRQAERIYRDVLRIDPRQGDALNLLGFIANQVGKPEEAIDLLSRAVAAFPQEPEFHGTLVAAFKGVGDVESAVRHYREAMRLKLDAVGFRVYLADALLESGQLDEAQALCLETLRLDRDSALPQAASIGGDTRARADARPWGTLTLGRAGLRYAGLSRTADGTPRRCGSADGGNRARVARAERTAPGATPDEGLGAYPGWESVSEGDGRGRRAPGVGDRLRGGAPVPPRRSTFPRIAR
jgi:tetratricopeptide (TPR) repeat protein